MSAEDDKARSDILSDIKDSLDAVKKQLNPSKGARGAIASNALRITTASGIGAFGTAAAGAATAIIAAAKGHSDSVAIGGLAFAAIALLVLAIIVVSDHRARASTYIALESSLPALTAAAASLTAQKGRGIRHT